MDSLYPILFSNSRRSWSPSGRSGIVFGLSGHRHTKKLFTPDIKRSLKKWLVERRENPYPNRQEKKELADSTGLTYIQICNWFANWRRKLKNTAGDGEEVVEDQRRTWNQLIRSYNDHAKGNVEQVNDCDKGRPLILIKCWLLSVASDRRRGGRGLQHL